MAGPTPTPNLAYCNRKSWRCHMETTMGKEKGITVIFGSAPRPGDGEETPLSRHQLTTPGRGLPKDRKPTARASTGGSQKRGHPDENPKPGRNKKVSTKHAAEGHMRQTEIAQDEGCQRFNQARKTTKRPTRERHRVKRRRKENGPA